MVRLPEKPREVRGDGIDELDQLFVIPAVDEVAILIEARELEAPQTPCQTRVDELALGVRQRDPGVLTDILPQELEMLVREIELGLVCRLRRGGHDSEQIDSAAFARRSHHGIPLCGRADPGG